jgi:hypothetical protein
MFIIATEGAKTEPQYFGIFNSSNAVVHVHCLKCKTASSPPQVLARMHAHLREEGLKPGDEAWLVVDKDQWTDQQLAELFQWSQGRINYGFAVSNPKFEFWLLLHFEEGNGIATSRECSERLARHLPNFAKRTVEVDKLVDGVSDAIRRARMKDNPPCNDWPRNTGTTVYRLVASLIA